MQVFGNQTTLSLDKTTLSLELPSLSPSPFFTLSFSSEITKAHTLGVSIIFWLAYIYISSGVVTLYIVSPPLPAFITSDKHEH